MADSNAGMVLYALSLLGSRRSPIFRTKQKKNTTACVPDVRGLYSKGSIRTCRGGRVGPTRALVENTKSMHVKLQAYYRLLLFAMTQVNWNRLDH